MTKETFMYITGITDPEQLANIMLLEGEEEPENGDWTELMKKWYIDQCEWSIRYEQKYLEAKYGKEAAQ